MKKILLITLTAAIALAAVWWHLSKNPTSTVDMAAAESAVEAAVDPTVAPAEAAPVETAPSQQPVIDNAQLQPTADDRVLGDINAPVTIVEYASLSCSHCADFHTKTVPVIKQRYIDSGKVRLIYRDYPLNAPALKASVLARCVSADKFFPLLDSLFSQQSQWAISGDYTAELKKIANAAGVSDEEFNSCINNKEIEAKIVQGYQQATQGLAVSSTPTIFINGERLVGANDPDSVAAKIEGLVNAAPAAVTDPSAMAPTDPAAAPAQATPDGVASPEAAPTETPAAPAAVDPAAAPASPTSRETE